MNGQNSDPFAEINPFGSADGTQAPVQTPVQGGENEKVGNIFELLMAAEATATPQAQVLAAPDEFGMSQYDRNITTKEDLYNLENFRGQQQSTADKFGNFLVRFPVSVGTNVAGGLAGLGVGFVKTVYKGAEALADDKDHSGAEIIRNIYDNELFDVLDGVNEALSDNLPFYYTDLERKKGLFSQAGTANFWFDKFANGMSFITGAVLTEMAATAIGGFVGSAFPGLGTVTIAGAAASGNAMRLNRLASKVFKGISRTSKQSKVLDVAEEAGKIGGKMDAMKVARQLATGAMYESSIEANTTYHTVLETMMEKEFGERFAAKEMELGRALSEEEKIELLTPEERYAVDSQASTIANFNFAGNFMLVGAGNAITIPRLYGVGMLGRMNNLSSKGLLGKVNKKFAGVPGDDLIDKGLAKVNLGAKTRGVGNWVARSAYEGFVEEGLQGVMAKTSEDYALRASLSDQGTFDMFADWMNSMGQGLSDTYLTTEGQTEIFIGSLAAAIGVPYSGGRGFTSGLGWMSDVEDQQTRRKTIGEYNDFQEKFKKELSELEKKFPDLQGKLKSGLFMLQQFSKNKQALEDAITSGDMKKSKDLDFDDVFEYMLHKVDTASGEEIEMEIEDIIGMKNETFKEMFGYEKEMSDEDVLKRKSYLTDKIRKDFKEVKEISQKIDRAIRIKDVDKFSGMMEPSSLGYQRRVLIHAASSIKNREEREKELISKLAELTGGKIVEVKGEVDRISYTDPAGKTRTISLGNMNTGTTVGEQIIETQTRIDDIQAIPVKERTVEQAEELNDLTGFIEDLRALPDITAPVVPLFREAKNSMDADTIAAWEKENIVAAAQNKAEVEAIFKDVRALRSDRIRFANTLKTFLDPQLAKLEAKKIEKQRAEVTKIITKAMDESEVRSRDFTIQLKNYKDTLEKQIREISSKLKAKSDDLVEIGADILQLKSAIEKFEKDPSRKRAKVGVGRSGFRMLTREQIEKELQDSKEVREELQREFEEFDRTFSKERERMLELQPVLEQAIKEEIDPEALPKELQQIHKALIRLVNSSGSDMFSKVRELLDENAKSLQMLEEFKQETADNLKALEELETLIKSFIEQFPDVTVFDSEGKWKEALAGAISGQDPKLALQEVEKAINTAKENLKRIDLRLERGTKRRQEIGSAYMSLRLFEALPEILKEPTYRTSGHDMDGIEEGRLSSEDLPKNYFLPDISYPGFWKTGGKNFSGKEDPMEGAANTVERLSNKEDLTPEEETALKIARSQVRWFEYLTKYNTNVLNSLSNKLGSHIMVLVTEDHLKENADLAEIQNDLEGTFTTVTVSEKDETTGKETTKEYKDIKAVMAYVEDVYENNKPTGERRLKFVTDEDGKAIFTSIPVPELEINGRDRFTNKFGDNAKRIRDEWEGTRKTIETSTGILYGVGISGKSPGTINLQRGEKNYAIDAVMGQGLENVAVRVASIAKTERDPNKYKLDDVKFGNIMSVKAKPGTVWAYDHARHLPIPMRRSLIDEDTSEQVIRMFEKYLEEIQKAKDSGMSLDSARKAAKNFIVKHTDENGKEVSAGKLWTDIIEKVVFINYRPGPYLLSNRSIKGEEAIVYGDMDEYVTLETIKQPDTREELKQFLMTKRHQVSKTAAENSTRQVRGKAKKGYKKGATKAMFENASVDSEGNPLNFYWPTFAEDGSVQEIKTYKNYSQYLLTKNSMGYAPLYTEAVNRKEATYLNPRAKGGYLIINQELGLVDTVSLKFTGKEQKKSYSKKNQTSNKTQNDQTGTADTEVSPTGSPLEAFSIIMTQAGVNPTNEPDVETPPFAKEEAGPEEKGFPTEPPAGFSEGQEPLDVDDIGTSEDGNKGKPEDLDDIDVPFLLDEYANSVNKLLEKYNASESKDEVERVLQMRPLEIIESEMLIQSIDGKAQAQLIGHGKVLLSRFASPGALFHEAFHDVSLYLLSPRDSKILYGKVRRVPGETTTYKGEKKKMSDLTDKEAEEWLAEEFRKFILLGEDFKFGEGTVEDTRNALQKFFDAIKNVLRKLLGLNSAFEYDPNVRSIEGLFSDIAGGKFLHAKRNSLRGNPGPYNMLAELPGYDAVYSRDVMHTLSGYLGPKFHRPFLFRGKAFELNRGMFVSKKLSQDPLNKRLLYAAYLSALEDMRSDLKESIQNLDSIEERSSEEELELQALKNTFELIGEVQGSKPETENMLVVEHYKYMEQLGMNVEAIEDVSEEDVTSRNMMSDHSSLEMSPSKSASGTTKLFLGTISDPTSKNSTGLRGTYDMSTVLKTLQNELAGRMSFQEQVMRMKDLADDPRYPWMKDAIDVFNFKITLDMAPSTVAIRTRFTTEMANTIAYPSIVKVEESGRIYELDPVSAKRELTIKSKWSANMKQMANKKASYVSIKNGKMVVDPNAKFNLLTLEGKPRYITLSDLALLIRAAKRPDQLLNLYKGLGVEFSNENAVLDLIKSRGIERFAFENLKEDAQMIIDDLIGRTEPFANIFDRRFAQSATRSGRLAELEAITGNMSVEGAYLNGAGKMEHNKMKNHAVSAIANMPYDSLSEYYNPVSYPFGTGSMFLEEKRNGEPIEIVNIAGLSPDVAGETGEKVGKLTENDIAVMHVYHTMNGISIIPRAADKGTEFGIKLREDFEFPKTADEAINTYVGYLRSEIASSAMGIVEGKHLKRFDKNISSLRIFKSIVNRSKDPINKFLGNKARMKKVREEWIGSNGESDILEAFIELHRDEIEADIRDQINSDVQDLMMFFESSELISPIDEKGFRNVKVFSSDMFRDENKEPTSEVQESDLIKKVEELAIRHFIGKNEVFRMFLNDPAFYSDLFKRISGAVSPKTMADVSNDLMEYINDGNTYIENGKLTFLSIKEPVSYISQEAQDIYNSILSDENVKQSWSDEIDVDEEGNVKGVKRKELEKADGILPVSLPTYRALKYAVGQWSDEMEDAYKKEMQLLRSLRAGKIMTTKDTQDVEGAAFPVDKFQYFGPSKVSNNTMHIPGFLKMSVMPIFPSLAYVNGVEYSNILKMLDAMDDNRVAGFVIPSAHKVGSVNSEHTVGYMQESGDMEFAEPTDFSKIDFDLRFFGSQLEIKPHWKYKVVRATQHAVQVSADLYKDGQAISAKAMILDERHNAIVGGMVRRAFSRLLKDLDIVQTEVDGVPSFKMSQRSYEAVLEKLEKEVGTKDGGKALMSAIEVLKVEKGPFKFDYFVDRYRMETMFYSKIGKDIIKRKLFGEGMVQAPELGYEVGYVKGKKIDSASLKFYEGTEGKWVMEVFMPHQFKELVGQDLKIGANGDIIVNGQLMQGTAELLEAIGIRIPTDGKHSIELIRIKGFLPQSAGIRMVVPGGLTLKAGSDFDIDKLITYLKTYRYVNGILSPIKFKDDIREWYAGQINMYASQIEDLFSQRVNVPVITQSGTILVDENITDQNVLVEAIMGVFKGSDVFVQHNLQNFIEFELESLIELQGRDIEDYSEKTGVSRTAAQKEFEKNDFKKTAELFLEKVSEFYNVYEEDGIFRLDPKSFDEWRAENPELTTYDVNSEGALQNLYMDTTKELLSMSDGNTLDEVMRPVNTDKYAELASTIAKLDSSLPNLEVVSDFHLETRLPHIVRVTSAFLQGKRVVGIAALASTHQIKGQKAGLALNTAHEYELLDGTFETAKMRFAGFEDTMDVISLSRIEDINNDRKISDNISQLVNASVDIVKKPIIHILNMGPDTAAAALVLMRAGVPLDSIAYFLNQPIVREYMRRNNINRSRLNRALDDREYATGLIASVKDQFKSSKTLPETFFTEDQLLKMIGKKAEDMTQDQLAYQQQILRDFLVYLELGSDMTTAITAQSFDTKLPKSRAHFALIQEQYDNVVNKGVFPNVEKITEGEMSFLKDMKAYNFVAQDLLKDLFVANDSIGEYKEARQILLNNLADPRNRMSMDDKLRILERFEQFMVSFILTRMEKEDGEKIADFADQMLFGNNTFAMQIANILTSANHPLKNNEFLNFLIPVVQEIREAESGIEKDNDYVEPQFKAMNVYDEAALYDSFMQIVDHDSRKGTRIAKDILYATLLQAGTMNTPFSFLDKIPGDFYLRVAKDVFEQIERDPESVKFTAESLLTSFYKNMINDPNAVPYVKGKSGSSVYTSTSKKRQYNLFTKTSDKTEKGKRVGEAKQRAQYKLEKNTPLNELTTSVSSVDFTGYGSRNYLNTSTLFEMSVRRPDDQEVEDDIDSNCKE